MWREKVRLARIALQHGIFHVQNMRLDKGITDIAAAGAIYHKEITRAMKVAQTADPESFVPPEWFKVTIKILIFNLTRAGSHRKVRCGVLVSHMADSINQL